ncbi:MAG: ubiquinone biosynthesis protein UbiH [Betaproteobacteria bacterium CG2_30_59_46]|nr:MAG: ubiquinone biosynthesis protein UbiH [Betaproteobacteria bacterium CG2_30_59_46]PIQ13607.1 MAG: ubiquinone biosynthesis protein UbiH [Hydrogenophilales bacterium CG18_big_fil_WC_8_21_14_2_50_58_12]PIY01708.1 MAG: ubiquinone biosynthesis protein UbiH [Hydrogenophilales bacterium CG_4_10_14_3_um_filter_58_23]PJB08488.1 MAG: ubiquinone biosynthesis protein UbiH [Hydrogenophilales bacterium CG_4_9_14_3_um_filter_59_35]
MNDEFDIIIVGAGLVGASFALAMKDSGLKLALVESVAPTAPAPEWISRVFAISPGSIEFLGESGVWQQFDAARIAPVRGMHIHGDDGKLSLAFDAHQSGLAELAVIAEVRQMQHSLWQALQRQENLALFCPARCASLRLQEEIAVLRLEDDRELRAPLIVGADGRDSWVRSQAGMDAEPAPYRQMGVIANFETELPHGDAAWEWFRVDGVLAFLPLPGKRISIVWTAFDERAAELMALPPDEFCRQVQEASHSALGELKLLGKPTAFPLRLLHLEHLVKSRVALIGDAAHNVHPLAGQGVNLGFQDARELAKVLKDRGPQPDCGDFFLLRRYERARKADILAMQLVTDGLQKLFNNRNPALKLARNLGLSLVGSLPWLKNGLAQHAVGRHLIQSRTSLFSGS